MVTRPGAPRPSLRRRVAGFSQSSSCPTGARTSREPGKLRALVGGRSVIAVEMPGWGQRDEAGSR